MEKKADYFKEPYLEVQELARASKDGVIADKLRAGRWIWGGNDPRKMNTYRLFRREFELVSLPAKSELWCFAEFRYKLYVNGRFVQTGPTPCQPEERLIDRHDISRFLQVGQNCIGFIVHCPGIMTGQWTLVNPALFAVARFDENKKVLGTDASWQTREGVAWRHPTQICGAGKGFQEWFVAADMPKGWSESGFDAAGWGPAIELPFYAYGEPEKLGENYAGYPTLKEFLPERLVGTGIGDGIITEEMRKKEAQWYTGARNRWIKQMGKWNMQSNNTPLPKGEPLPEPVAMRAHYEKHTGAIKGMVVSTGKDNRLPLIIEVPENGHLFVTFDFGTVRSGLLMLEIESESGGTVDLAWDDRIREDGSVPAFRATPNCERIEVPAGQINWDGFFDRGMRYLQIILRDFRGKVTIHKAGIRELLTPVRVSKAAVFESENELLNRIWQAAVQTMRLYMTGSASGDPIRERARWFYDDTMAMRMAFYCFGEWRTWRRALELTAQGQRADGALGVISPGHFEDYNMVIGSCFWVVQVAEYFRCTADKWFAEKMLTKIDKQMNYELRFADKDGLLYETPGRRFLSWADGRPRRPFKAGETWQKKDRVGWGDFFEKPTRGYNAIINIYWLWSLREAAGLADKLGVAQTAGHYNRIFEKGRAAFERMFWDEKTELYRDNVFFDRDGNVNEPTFCESTLFFMMRAGLLEKEKGLRCLDKIMQEDFVCCRTSGGLEGGALASFLIDSGRTGEAIKYYLDRWGEPIKNGLTTCGEEFFHLKGNSDCHIHGATPARDFLEYLAGIRILSAWWDEVLLSPPVDSSELPALRASVPTPKGNIEVEIVKHRDKRKVYRYRLPAGCQGYLRTARGRVRLDNLCGEVPLMKEELKKDNFITKNFI